MADAFITSEDLLCRVMQDGSLFGLKFRITWSGPCANACRFEEAERLCRNAIMILEKSVGAEDVNVAAALSLQATCLQ